MLQNKEIKEVNILYNQAGPNKEKGQFLIDLIKEVYPELYPNLFPASENDPSSYPIITMKDEDGKHKFEGLNYCVYGLINTVGKRKEVTDYLNSKYKIEEGNNKNLSEGLLHFIQED